MTMATDGACVWNSLNIFMAFSSVCPKDTGCHVLPATLFQTLSMWAGIESGSFGSAPNSPAWEGVRLKFSTTADPVNPKHPDPQRIRMHLARDSELHASVSGHEQFILWYRHSVLHKYNIQAQMKGKHG